MVIHLEQLLQDKEYFDNEDYFKGENLDLEVSEDEIAAFLEVLKQVPHFRNKPYTRRDIKTIIKAVMSAGINIQM